MERFDIIYYLAQFQKYHKSYIITTTGTSSLNIMTKIYFGKYKNKTIDDLVKEDPKYLLWLAKQGWVKDNIIEAIGEAHGRIELTFGRHAGEYLNTVQESDPSYYQWLLKDSRFLQEVSSS